MITCGNLPHQDDQFDPTAPLKSANEHNENELDEDCRNYARLVNNIPFFCITAIPF